MSMKRFSRGALRIAQQVASRVENLNGTWIIKVLPRSLRPLLSPTPAQVITRVALPRIPARNPFVRLIQMVVRNQRAIVRPFSNLLMNHRQLSYHEQFRQRPMRVLFKRPRRNDGIIERIRDIFGSKERYNEHLKDATLPDRLSAYDIGPNIGYGCNAAVYALRLREERLPGEIRPHASRSDYKSFPLALKLMYNYDLDRTGEDFLWRGMGAELTPLPKAATLLRGRMSDFRPLPCTHPNIVHMSTAFVDALPLLSDAREKYPEALPTAPFYSMIVDEPKTLFIVMKRYRMTLRDYQLTNSRNYWTSRALLAQLLEGCVFLYNHKVAQRDMKSDNILLSFDKPGEIPFLVISDFGCALSKGSFLVNYNDETVDLGGNLATRAPEIACATPPSTVDFTLADTWAAGALAYEIYTRVNPFYSSLKSRTYEESDLPALSPIIPAPIQRVIRDLLKRDPRERLLPTIAANTLSLSLFRFGADLRKEKVRFRDLFKQHGLNALSKTMRKVSSRVEGTLDNVLSLLAAETFISRSAPHLVSRAELQLRATFMSRMSRDELWAAMQYFEDSPPESEVESELTESSAV